MGSDAPGRRHPTAARLKAGREAADGSTRLIRGRKPVVQIVETFGEKMKPNFVETLDSVAMVEELKFDLAPVMIYCDDITHIVTEEGSLTCSCVAVRPGVSRRSAAWRASLRWAAGGIAKPSRRCGSAGSSAVPRISASISCAPAGSCLRPVRSRIS